MEQLTWMTVASLLARYGPEVTDFIIRKVQARAIVGIEEWEELFTIARKTPQSQLADAIALAGLPATDPRVVALLAMVPAKP